MIACYLELYGEGEVKHINGVWPNLKIYSLLVYIMHTGNGMHMCKIHPINTQTRAHTSTFDSEPILWEWVGGTIDFTFLI